MGFGPDPLKKMNKAITKAATTSFKRSLTYAVRPDKAIKEIAHNPLQHLSKALGVDTLFKVPQTEGQAGRAAPSTDNEEIQTAQDRVRMISRQGLQGANPIMLLGQDFQPSNLDKDPELGGERK